MSLLVPGLLVVAILAAGAAVIEMLVAWPKTRLRNQWNAIFFPAGAFLVMSVTIFVDVGTKPTHTARELLLASVTMLMAIGSALGVRSLLASMQQQQRRDDEMLFLRERYERLFKGNEMPIVVVDRATLEIVDANASAQVLLGTERVMLLGTSLEALDFEQDVREAVRQAAEEGRTNVELRLRRVGAAPLDLLVHTTVTLVGESELVYGIVEDVTERNAARAELLEQKQKLAHLADHDVLTGLPNRRVFDEALERAVARARRDSPSAVMFIDVDDFKEVNDVQGHQAGDAALVAISHILSSTVRVEDIVARMGGDEFAIVLEGLDAANALGIANRLVAEVSEVTNGLGLSVGLASVRGQTTAVDVVRRADACMYAAKSAGGNRVKWEGDADAGCPD